MRENDHFLCSNDSSQLEGRKEKENCFWETSIKILDFFPLSNLSVLNKKDETFSCPLKVKEECYSLARPTSWTARTPVRNFARFLHLHFLIWFSSRTPSWQDLQ